MSFPRKRESSEVDPRVKPEDDTIHMNQNLIKKITNDTRETYDQIAEEFSHTRHSLWPELLPILDYIKDGDKILDAGCGNGRILKLFSGKLIDYTGIDPSKKLIEFAKKLNPNQGVFLTNQVEKLPFPDNHFDHILMIAVLHHIPSRSLRQHALLELKRVLKPGGMLFITNWNRWKLKFIFYIIKGLFVQGFDWGDFYLPWNNKTERYYHAFTKNDLKREIEQAGFTVIKNTTERDNFVTFCQKSSNGKTQISK